MLFYLNLLIPVSYSLIFSLSAFIIAFLLFTRRPREFKDNFEGKVSIVIAARNEESVIEKTIINLERSKYKNFEILVINDGSTDSTGEILNKLKERFSNLRVVDIPIEEKHGKVRALNIASRMINGDLMMILDADALVDENYISGAIKPFSDPSIGFVQTGRRVFNHSFVPEIYDGDFALTNIMMEYVIAPRSFGSGFILRAKYIKDLFPLKDSISDDQQISNLISKKKIKGTFNSTVMLYESAPLSFKTLIKQRKRWFLGSFMEMIRNNMSGFFLNTITVFLADIIIVSLFIGRFSFFNIAFICFLVFIPLILLMHRKKFKIGNILAKWAGSVVSYLVDIMICNASIFLSVVKFGKDVKWFKTPREGVQA